MLARDRYRCRLRLDGCTGHATHRDHIIPVSKGGPDTLANSQAACENCNLKKGASV